MGVEWNEGQHRAHHIRHDGKGKALTVLSIGWIREGGSKSEGLRLVHSFIMTIQTISAHILTEHRLGRGALNHIAMPSRKLNKVTGQEMAVSGISPMGQTFCGLLQERLKGYFTVP